MGEIAFIFYESE